MARSAHDAGLTVIQQMATLVQSAASAGALGNIDGVHASACGRMGSPALKWIQNNVRRVNVVKNDK